MTRKSFWDCEEVGFDYEGKYLLNKIKNIELERE